MREGGMCGYKKTFSSLNDVIERLQVRRRSDRRRVHDSRTRKWAEKSVWSEVCAKDLGLIVAPAPSVKKESANELTPMDEKKSARKNLPTHRKIHKNSKIYKSRKKVQFSSSIDQGGVIKAEKLSKTRLFNEPLSALPSASSVGKNSSKLRKRIVYNPFYIFRNALKSFNPDEHIPMENLVESANLGNWPENNFSPDSFRSPLKDDVTRYKENRGGSKFRGNKRVPVASRVDKEKRELRKTKKTKPAKEDKIPAGSLRKNCLVNRTGARRGRKNIIEILRKAISPVSSVKKNDYEDSDIDESLLVDPSKDLAQCLLETIDDKIELTNPEFDVTRDLSLDLNSEFQSFEHFPTPAGKVPGTLKKVPKTVNSSKKTAKRGSKTDETSMDKMAVPRDQQNGVARMVTERSGRSFAAIVADNGQQEKRRRSSDCAVIAGRTNSFQENTYSPENSSFEKLSGRITRSSLKNFMSKENSENRAVGTIVWGNCTGWWPGFVVDPRDVGMLSKPEKTWICWIGEYKISHLREKTQIQSFSTCFHERMIETLSTKNSKDLSYRACLETLELLSDYLLDFGPLTKPYHVWASRYLSNLENIDALILHPYPPSIRPRLDQLKKTNVKTTEKYLSELRSSTERTGKNFSSGKTVATKDQTHPAPGYLPLTKQKPGVIAWAKIMGQMWWPAIIVDYRDWGMKEPSFGCQWIVWYGDDTMSQVHHRFFLSFENGIGLMKEHAINSKRECYRRGVVDAAKDYCSRYGYRTEDWRLSDVFSWFESNDEENPTEGLSGEKNVLPGIPGIPEISQKYPARIMEVLRKHRGNWTIVAAAREHMIQDSEALRLVEAGVKKIDDLCLMCLKDRDLDEKKMEHPFFVGKLCGECSEKYVPTIFAYGDDGKCFFCTICAGSDTVVMCDEENCPRVYCTACIKYLVAPDSYDDIILEDPWFCFVCEVSKSSREKGLLKPRDDWKDRVAGLFSSNRESVLRQVERFGTEKRKVRVLSLFDGISAGLVALKKLGIQIEVYYTSEIDPDAEMISSAHHGNEIVKRLGDVRLITEEKLREISPIDLLIGGSPCNDLSLVNPLRLGLHDPNGTGILFFEYRRIKDFLEMENEGRAFLWMFENVAAMPSKYRLEINENLGREPELIDSANYSPQHRPRLYWSNFPIVSFPLSNQDLQDVLTPNCNRHALVKKIRTVTTRVNSLKQGKDALKPILMNETNDTLWITELEEIFGFPRHYTDVKNLCATKRQKLIAMSWSVQTIVEIMRPLCNFFYTRNDDTS